MSTKEEIETGQKVQWLREHLPYELMMARYSLIQMQDPSVFWLDWNAYHSSFAVSACNLAAFLTNGEKKGNNFQACEFVDGFKSRKGNLQNAFVKLEPQVFHLGKARPTEGGKFSVREAEEILNWIEEEMAKFVSQLGSWGEFWNDTRSRPETRLQGLLLGLPPQLQTASSGDPTSTSLAIQLRKKD